jgi:hypothetical protein
MCSYGDCIEELILVKLAMNIQKSSVHYKELSHTHAVAIVHPTEDLALIHGGYRQSNLK